jgi:hypothetical protein
VQPDLLALRANNIKHLDDLLRWYRFFKEMRNCVAHDGGTVSAKVANAFSLAAAMPLTKIGIRRDFSGPTPIAGGALDIATKDAILMLPVIVRIANAFDAKYCSTSDAEQDLRRRIADKLATKPVPNGRTLTGKQKWFQGFFPRHVGITPGSWPATFNWLTLHGLL